MLAAGTWKAERTDPTLSGNLRPPPCGGTRRVSPPSCYQTWNTIIMGLGHHRFSMPTASSLCLNSFRVARLHPLPSLHIRTHLNLGFWTANLMEFELSPQLPRLQLSISHPWLLQCNWLATTAAAIGSSPKLASGYLFLFFFGLSCSLFFSLP